MEASRKWTPGAVALSARLEQSWKWLDMTVNLKEHIHCRWIYFVMYREELQKNYFFLHLQFIGYCYLGHLYWFGVIIDF